MPVLFGKVTTSPCRLNCSHPYAIEGPAKAVLLALFSAREGKGNQEWPAGHKCYYHTPQAALRDIRRARKARNKNL